MLPLTRFSVLVFFLVCTTAQANTSSTVETEAESSSFWPEGVSLNYYGVLLGPSLLNPSSFQPDLRGQPDRTRPVLIRNYLSLGYNLSDSVVVSATGNLAWQPVRTQALFFQDPFVTVSDASLFRSGRWNFYADLRSYFPVSRISQQSRVISSFQTFQSLTYEWPESRLQLGLNGSVRTNFYRKHGFGTDFEIYIGPNIRYQVSPKVSLSLLYEWQSSHFVGTKFASFFFAGSDLEPGVMWEVSPKMVLNPYLNIPTFGPVDLKSTSLGMFFSWNLI